MICEPLCIDYPCTTSVEFNVQKGALDSCSLNSSLIDFNGEILISVWSRSTGRGQSHLLGRAGHPVCESQSIMLAQCAKKKGKKGKKKNMWKRAEQNTIPSPYYSLTAALLYRRGNKRKYERDVSLLSGEARANCT